MGVLDLLGQFRGAVETKVRGPAMEARGKLLQSLLEEAEARKYKTDEANRLEEQRQQGVGLAKQLNRSGLFNDPTAQTAVGLMSEPGSRAMGIQMAATLLDPAAQQKLANDKLSGQATAQGMTLDQQRLALDQQRTAAYIGNMNLDDAAKAQGAQLEGLKFGLKNEADLRSEYTKAPLVAKGAQAISSWKMLDQALTEDNEMALQAAIVAAAQIQEPGLAVRNDDRIAYSGANPIVDQMVQAYNTAVSGEGLTTGTKQRLLALGTKLAGVHARNIEQVTDQYRKIAINTPGARPDQIIEGAGIDWDTTRFLIQMTEDQGNKGPGGR